MKSKSVGKSDITRKAGLALMTAVLLMVFAFGANGLNTDAIWTDELYAIEKIGGFNPPYSPAQVLNAVVESSPDHVPLFFLLGAGWANNVGWTQFALRLLPVLFGLLMIAWTYRLGADMFSRFTGTVASFFLGASAYIVLYVHDFRMYSLFLMLAAMHLWLYWRLAHRPFNRLTYAAFGASAVALFYTHVFSFILFASIGLYHLVFVGKTRLWLKITLGWCVAFALLLPYFPVVINGTILAAEKGNVTSRAASVQELFSTLLLLLSNGSGIVVLVLAIVLLFSVTFRRNRQWLQFMLLPLAMLGTILAVNELVGIIPLTRMRYFLILWVPLAIIVAQALSTLPRRNIVTLLILMLWSGAGYQFYRSSTIMNHVGSMLQTRLYPPLQDYVFRLDGKVRPHDYLLGFSDLDHVNKDLNGGRSVADYYTQLQLGIDGAFIRSRSSGDALQRAIHERIDHQPFLLFAYNPQDLAANHASVEAAIRSNYVACDVMVDTPTLLVQRYVNAMLDCGREYARIEYHNGVTLVDGFANYLPNENRIVSLTGWEVENEELLYEYNISLQIITPDWQSNAQIDRHLHDDILKWFPAELSTAELAPGDYRVMVIVYDRETIKKARGTDLTSGRADDIFPLLTFTVEP